MWGMKLSKNIEKISISKIPESLVITILIFFRKAVRDRFEATRCWQYDYDGLNPPPEASESNRTTTSNYDLNCDITSECSTPYGKWFENCLQVTLCKKVKVVFFRKGLTK